MARPIFAAALILQTHYTYGGSAKSGSAYSGPGQQLRREDAVGG